MRIRALVALALTSLLLMGCAAARRMEVERRISYVEDAVEANQRSIGDLKKENDQKLSLLEAQIGEINDLRAQLAYLQERELAQSSGPEPETVEYRVWYGTNRRPWSYSGTTTDFLSERDDELHYGSCWVRIPKSHQPGSIGSSRLKRFLTGKDDRLLLLEIEPVSGGAEFLEDMGDSLADTSEGSVLVYIHGYNVSFDEAAIRAAQIGYDLGVNGVTAFFSWPSKGRLEGYVADEATIGASEKYLEEFLEGILDLSEARTVNVIAHSMGNRAFLRVAERLAASRPGELFNQIVLAAPDVDQQLFEHLAEVYDQVSSGTTLYVSGKDRALQGSGVLHDYPRAGFGRPVVVAPGIETVEVSNLDLDLLGHGYFAEAAEILNDMRRLIVGSNSPSNRRKVGQGYWLIGD